MEELKERLAKLEVAVSLLLSHNRSTAAMLDGIATKADENFAKIEDRLGKIENRLNVLTNETLSNFTEVGDQIGGIESEIKDQLGGLESEIKDQLGGIKAEIVKIGAATRYEQHHEDQKRFNIPS